MAKKQKTTKKPIAAENSHSAEAKQDSNAPGKARKNSTKGSARKTTAPRATKVRKTAPTATAVAQPTPEEIQLRAYFLSEHRHRHGTAGDHHSDWLEARRQLMIEAQRN